MHLFAWLLVGYVAVGCAYWIWLAIGTIRIVRAVSVLADQAPPEPERWPTLSVVVPACNEAESIETAAASILDQDYPELELILINDRSEDATGELIDRIADGDDRVRPMHIDQIPDDWLGKVHALARGEESARGDWILFADADVHFSPGVLRRAVAWSEYRGLDHLAAFPDIWPSGILQDAMVTSFLRTFGVGMRCWAVENPDSNAFIGVGAFNLIRSAAFRRTRGFEWLRLEVGDDVGLGLMMKQSGARCSLVNATGLLGLYWYRSLGEMASGAEKGYASVANCSFAKLMAICLTSAALEWSLLMVAWPVPWVRAAGVVMLGSWVTSNVLLARWSRRRVGPSFLSPLATAIGLALSFRAGWLGWKRGGVMWRGTLYPRKLLIQGRRIRLFSLFSKVTKTGTTRDARH